VPQKARGNVDASCDHGILGKGAWPRAPRWSIALDVPGWTDWAPVRGVQRAVPVFLAYGGGSLPNSA
jgi:hypothetical protein